MVILKYLYNTVLAKQVARQDAAIMTELRQIENLKDMTNQVRAVELKHLQKTLYTNDKLWPPYIPKDLQDILDDPTDLYANIMFGEVCVLMKMLISV